METVRVIYNLYSDFIFDAFEMVQIFMQAGVKREFKSSEEASEYYKSTGDNESYADTLFMVSRYPSTPKFSFMNLRDYAELLYGLYFVVPKQCWNICIVEVPRKVILPFLREPKY